MLEMRYPAIISRDHEGKDYVVTFPDLEGAVTGGRTFDEACDEAADCLASWLAFALAQRKPIPAPSGPTKHRGKKRESIPVPFWIAPKIALYQAMTEQGLSNSDLARKLGVSETVVRRMLDPDHATKPAKIEGALRAVGRRLYLVSAA